MLKIAVSIPTVGTWENDFAVNVVGLISHTSQHLPGSVVFLNTASSSILLQNRFDLVKAAQSQGCTHMLWLDDDMTFPVDALVRLLAAGKDIVAANYPARKQPHHPVAAKNRHERLISHGKTGLELAAHTGLGVCLTAMSVYDHVPKPYFYFGWAPKDEQFVGEDVFFFREATKAGIDLWIDHDLSNEVGHIGAFEYTHDLVS